MITIEKAKSESRARDKKRGRFVLQVGEPNTIPNYRWHITRDELLGLILDGIEALGARVPGRPRRRLDAPKPQ